MDTFADKRIAFKAFYFEDQTATVNFDEFGLTADGRTHWTGFQMFDIDSNAYGGVAIANLVGDTFEASLFHQGNHGGGGKDLQSPRAVDGGSVFMLHQERLAVAESL